MNIFSFEAGILFGASRRLEHYIFLVLEKGKKMVVPFETWEWDTVFQSSYPHQNLLFVQLYRSVVHLYRRTIDPLSRSWTDYYITILQISGRSTTVKTIADIYDDPHIIRGAVSEMGFVFLLFK